MKSQQRIVYWELCSEIDSQLCAFCRYGNSMGSCGESYYECRHPIRGIRYEEDCPEPGDDCWSFSPELPLPVIADIVGVIIAQHWKRWSFYVEKEGPLLVFGRV
ncbi:MAG: hypothetical protein PHQ43_05465 [Dehalococcoidales bacterium]|nr:hypothetical protein [Dehalococcoidales bacterium]